MSKNILKSRKILKKLDDVILIVSDTGELLDYSRLPESHVSAAGDNPQQISTFFPTPALNLVLENVKLALATRQTQVFETHFILQGTPYYYSIKISAFGEEEALLLLRDISRQKRYEEFLSRSEARFRILLEAAPQGIILLDMHGMIHLVNTQVEQLTGYERDELEGQSIEVLLPARYRDRHIRERGQYIFNPVTRKMAAGKDVPLLNKQGADIPVEISLSSVEMHDGLYILAFVTDISDRRLLENKVRRFEKLEAIGQLAGGIAHDFNNVLAAIIGLTELALRKMEPQSDAVENLKLVLDKAQNAATLVSQLLAFSKQQILSPRKLNLNDVIRTNSKMLQRYLGEDIHLKTELDEDLHSILADQSALDQIITNLSINARDAMPDGGELIIKTENTDLIDENVSVNNITKMRACVKLSVIDSGVGMRQEVQKHIFEPFFTTKDQGEGTGLGLATVYGLVQQHNGLLQFSSSPGEGTVFEIFLPVSEKTDRNLPSHTKEDQPLSGGTESILIVDDEVNILKTAKTILEDYGYEVFIASDGKKALATFKKKAQKIDLVISDIVMPDMSGVELKLLLKKINPALRFIFMSAYSDKVPPEKIELRKPFLSRELVKKVRDILDRP